jgi:hypothetical protein
VVAQPGLCVTWPTPAGADETTTYAFRELGTAPPPDATPVRRSYRRWPVHACSGHVNARAGHPCDCQSHTYQHRLCPSPDPHDSRDLHADDLATTDARLRGGVPPLAAATVVLGSCLVGSPDIERQLRQLRNDVYELYQRLDRLEDHRTRFARLAWLRAAVTAAVVSAGAWAFHDLPIWPSPVGYAA